MKKYIHLMRGKPAYYEEGEQVVFAPNGVKLDELLVDSLPKIRKQWEKSEAWRVKQNLTLSDWNHSYLRVEIEAKDADKRPPRRLE